MGISTVSGPFRSKNGFQQLDENGVWVPVAGGGGGSSGYTALTRGNSGDPPFAITLPENPSVGDTYRYVFPFGFDGTTTEITSQVVGTDLTVWVIKEWESNGSTNVNFGVSPTIYLDAEENSGVTTYEIIYTGLTEADGNVYGTYAVTVSRIDA